MGRASRRKRERHSGKRTTEEILLAARKALRVAERGATDTRHSTNPEDRMMGARNVMVFGRSVGNILEHLRSGEPAFDAWYRRYDQEPLMKYIVDFRDRVLKQGELQVQTELHITELHHQALTQNLPAPPPGAKAFFVGDEIGGNGWEVELPGGHIEKFYIQLPRIPGLIVDNVVQFADAPPEIQGMPIEDACAEAVRFLRRMVEDAEGHFRR